MWLLSSIGSWSLRTICFQVPKRTNSPTYFGRFLLFVSRFVRTPVQMGNEYEIVCDDYTIYNFIEDNRHLILFLMYCISLIVVIKILGHLLVIGFNRTINHMVQNFQQRQRNRLQRQLDRAALHNELNRVADRRPSTTDSSTTSQIERFNNYANRLCERRMEIFRRHLLIPN
ncbi:hypothetical protein SNEBB_007177 [Seison nebaliae]|nr:hypothetical protein SNEBB_007177 [Seison nebaliae]